VTVEGIDVHVGGGGGVAVGGSGLAFGGGRVAVVVGGRDVEVGARATSVTLGKAVEETAGEVASGVQPAADTKITTVTNTKRWR
jgi:hypothetical protein